MKTVRQWGRWLAVIFMTIILLCGCVPSDGAEPEKDSLLQTSETQLQEPQTQGNQEEKTQTEETKAQKTQAQETSQEELTVEEDGEYTSAEEVALYLHIYAKLPGNYITKNEAEKLGWDSRKGNLWDVAPGKSIGGSHYGNYEKVLPDKKGRKYFECDINYDGKYRGAERIIYSNDGLIYYTTDHYKTFALLYE